MKGMGEYGARIERGEIAEAAEGLYVVQSLTRDGIITPALPTMGGATYDVGDRVYYFLFDDGHGLILAAFE
jgi:hypothetical protein